MKPIFLLGVVTAFIYWATQAAATKVSVCRRCPLVALGSPWSCGVTIRREEVSLLGGDMVFSQQALNEMSEAKKAIGGKYEGLLMKM